MLVAEGMSSVVLSHGLIEAPAVGRSDRPLGTSSVVLSHGLIEATYDVTGVNSFGESSVVLSHGLIEACVRKLPRSRLRSPPWC